MRRVLAAPKPRGGAGLPGREALPMRRHAGLKGVELAARRRAAGLTQRQLAEAAGAGRTAVQYWEAAPHLGPRGWAVRRMAEALGWAVWPASETTIRPRGMGCYPWPAGGRPCRRPACRLQGPRGPARRPPPHPLRGQDPQGHAMPQQERAGQAPLQVPWRAVHRRADARGHQAHPGSPAAALGKGAGQVSCRTDRQSDT